MDSSMVRIGQILEQLKRLRVLAILAAIRWVIVLGTALFSLGYIAYKEHSDISAQVTADFATLASKQETLLNHLTSLLPRLLDPNVSVELDQELEQTRDLAQDVVVSLGQFRAPTSRIDNARYEYRQSLESLIGVTNRIRRSGVDGMALELHNSVQLTANEAGDFLSAVEDFQGGAWPQVIGTFF